MFKLSESATFWYGVGLLFGALGHHTLMVFLGLVLVVGTAIAHMIMSLPNDV